MKAYLLDRTDVYKTEAEAIAAAETKLHERHLTVSADRTICHFRAVRQGTSVLVQAITTNRINGEFIPLMNLAMIIDDVETHF
jgi:hypothetical protein